MAIDTITIISNVPIYQEDLRTALRNMEDQYDLSVLRGRRIFLRCMSAFNSSCIFFNVDDGWNQYLQSLSPADIIVIFPTTSQALAAFECFDDIQSIVIGQNPVLSSMKNPPELKIFKSNTIDKESLQQIFSFSLLPTQGTVRRVSEKDSLISANDNADHISIDVVPYEGRGNHAHSNHSQTSATMKRRACIGFAILVSTLIIVLMLCILMTVLVCTEPANSPHQPSASSQLEDRSQQAHKEKEAQSQTLVEKIDGYIAALVKIAGVQYDIFISCLTPWEKVQAPKALPVDHEDDHQAAPTSHKPEDPKEEAKEEPTDDESQPGEVGSNKDSVEHQLSLTQS